MAESSHERENPLNETGKIASRAKLVLAGLSARQKNALLLHMADRLEANAADIVAANGKDMAIAKVSGLPPAMQDRLLLTEDRLKVVARDVRNVAALPDPVGQILEGRKLDSGLEIIRKRVPLGVVATIYEARPNVTVDMASLCLKTGNAVILRGGKETTHTNEALTAVIRAALKADGLPEDAVQSIIDPDRALVSALLQLDRYVDMLIPRGGAGLHRLCIENSRIPVISGGIGVCHIYVDEGAAFARSLEVLANAKNRPSVCNSVETILVHENIAADFLPLLALRMKQAGIVLHAAPKAFELLSGKADNVTPVHEEEYDREWLTFDVNVKVVRGLEEALEHIRDHGTGHSDAILTESMEHAEAFVNAVDSSSVYVNASTRFTDGSEFGLGAEVAISTQKLHARGPMGLEALTSYKWIGYGHYTIRG